VRVLICIGCNSYAEAEDLAGAERDAQRVYNVLIKPSVGDYDASRSKLLLSPSIAEVKQAVFEALFASPAPLDTLTFFFAGHGVVHAGGFYMWVRDTKANAQSMTAISLSELFRNVNEAAPSQTNIVIDACESGGLIKDLGALLSSDQMGQAHTPGVTLLATSAMDQSASETIAGGLGTNAMLDCIEGRQFVQDRAPTLDLLEIGRRITEMYRWPNQTPVLWGINLLDSARFCRNPNFSIDPAKPFTEVIRALPHLQSRVSQGAYERLWRAYSAINDIEWSPRHFLSEISGSIQELKESPEVIAQLVGRFDEALAARASESRDAYRPAIVRAAVAVALLPYLSNSEIAVAAEVLLKRLIAQLTAIASGLSDELAEDKYALLRGSGGGPADLFYLPLRVSSVLAWTGASILIDRHSSVSAKFASVFGKLLSQMLEHYGGCFVAMSDSQASAICVVAAAACTTGHKEELEELLGRYFYSLVAHKCKVARGDLAPEKVPTYLLARESGSLDNVVDLIEQPAETLTVLLHCASLLGIASELDRSLWKLDRVPFSAYTSGDFSQFGAEVMRGGRNLVWSIGFDVFRVEEFLNSWPSDIIRPTSETAASLSIVASLLFPDRVPWFCLTASKVDSSEAAP
jgi:hypothetical protein